MNFEKQFEHTTLKADYLIKITLLENLQLEVHEKHGLSCWKASFSEEVIRDLTTKTGHALQFDQFVDLLVKAGEQKHSSCFIAVLTSQDLLNLKAKAGISKMATKSNKRYIILTFAHEAAKYHYPLSLSQVPKELSTVELKQLYSQLRLELQTLRTSALNDTNKTENSMSIQYTNTHKQATLKELDQHQSEHEILKAKLARLIDQADKKKANIEIEAAIQKIKVLKDSLDIPNAQLIEWKDKLTSLEQTQAEYKQELNHLHKRICGLLTTDKEITAKKKGDEVEKELNLVRNQTKKNAAEIDKLKKELEGGKTKIKELQGRAKKLNSEKEVIRKGSKRGPYSSAGSVRSYNSFNSWSSKKSYNSSASKQSSNYSYNSRKLR